MDEDKKEGEKDYKESPEEDKKLGEENDKKPVEDNHKTLDEPSGEPSREPSEPKQALTDKLRKNPFIVSTIVCAVLAVFLLIAVTSGGMTGKVVSGEVAGENLIEFLNTVADSEVTLIEVNDDGDFYEVIIEFEEQEMSIYVTKDGARYTSNLIPLVSMEDDGEAQLLDIPKSDKPEVELFIMTHCPYGTQAEKGLIPVIETLGENIDATIRFVHYFMHEPEETETPREICIREEQSEKWLDYLRCFLEDGDADRCLLETSIDKSALDDCIDNRAEGYYAEDSGLSEDYGVQGSPTLIINGQIVSSSRSPAAYLATICQAFNDVPSECEETLSSTTPSPMWGWDASGVSTEDQC